MNIEFVDIRVVDEGDLKNAFAVLRELRDQLDLTTFKERLNRQSEAGYRLYAVFQHEELMGVIGLRPVETMARGRHLHVDDLVVTKLRRGQGIGKRLLKFAEEYANSHHLQSIFLDSRPEVIEFYEHQGFTTHSATLMRKRLQ